MRGYKNLAKFVAEWRRVEASGGLSGGKWGEWGWVID